MHLIFVFKEHPSKKRKTITIVDKAEDRSDISVEAERKRKYMKYVQTLNRWVTPHSVGQTVDLAECMHGMFNKYLYIIYNKLIILIKKIYIYSININIYFIYNSNFFIIVFN